MTALLDIDGLAAGYGDFQALFDVHLHIDEGETVALIGANGAGKSTLLGTVAGAVQRFAGSIHYAAADLDGLSASRRVAAGISLVPEGRRVFPSLNVLENLQVGAYLTRPGPWTTDKVFELFPILDNRRRLAAGSLSGGEQQALAIGRALMSNPRLLLLDEVSLGLAPVVVKSLYEALPAIREQGTTVALVEQDINTALEVADRVYCLLEGRVVLEGAPGHLDHERITAAYFGMQEQ